MLGKIKKWLLPDEENEQKILSNQALVDQVLESFRETIERESFNKRMMYDCSYLVLMRPEDFRRSELRLASITEGILDEFYDYINQKKEQFPRYEPIGNSWDFQYSSTLHGVDGVEIPAGTVQVVSAPTSEKSWTELSSEQIKVSISSKHSKYSKYDLNANTFANIDILSKGHFRVKFRSGFFAAQPVGNVTSPNVSGDRMATIQFVVNKQRYSFPMKEKQLKITKAIEGLTSTATLLCIDEPSHSLQKEHLMIKYEEQARAFYIALFAPAFVNEQSLQISEIGATPAWHPLKNVSTIVCGIFQIDFTANTGLS